MIDEMELQRRLKQLDVEQMPSRDLWQGIERRVSAMPQPERRQNAMRWIMPISVAASVLMATTALILSVSQFQSGDFDSVVPMEMNYGHSLVSTNSQWRSVNHHPVFANVDSQAQTDIVDALIVLMQAQDALRRQIIENPADHRLRHMLARVQEQERDLLQTGIRQGHSSL